MPDFRWRVVFSGSRRGEETTCHVTNLPDSSEAFVLQNGAELPVEATASGGGVLPDLPSWKDQHRRVALESPSKDLGSFDTQIDPVVLDSRERRLRDARRPRQVVLTHLL